MKVQKQSREESGYPWTTLIVTASVSGAVCLLIGLLLGVVLGGKAEQPRSQQTVQQVPAKAARTLEDLRGALMGLPPEKVIEQIGRPDITHQEGAEWIYFRGRYDPVTQQGTRLRVLFSEDEKTVRLVQ